MANRTKLEALRQAVLGNERGREAEVSPDGQVVLSSGSDQDVENQPEQEGHRPKGAKMSPHAFAGR